MRWYRKLTLRVRSLFRKDEAERDLQDEIQFHLQNQIDDNIAKGMTAKEARRVALISLGGMEAVKEKCRDERDVSYLQNAAQDLRFGFRMLRRNPGFSILAVLCLTLGIGANAAVFSWIEGLLLRPFPLVAHQDRMVAVASTARGTGHKEAAAETTDDVSWPDFQDFQKSCTLFDAFIVDRIMGTSLSIGDRAEWVGGSVISSNYFSALGIRPMLGRAFEPAEESGRNAHPVTIISYWLWKNRFNSDPAIIGKTQLLNGVPHTIVGVAPEGFYGTFVGWPMQIYVPVSMEETFNPGGYKLEDRGAQWIEGFAVLKPGVTRAQAQAEISNVAQRLEKENLATNKGRGVKLFPLWETPFNQAGELLPTLKITFAVVLLVLLIACANVSSLLLVRALARRHELTVRMALGSRRGRLVRQLLTEGLILSGLAAVGGLAVAYLCRNLLLAFFPGGGGSAALSARLVGEIDWRVLAVSAGVCVVSTLIFALAPAIQSSKIDLASSLNCESGTVFGGRARSRLRSSLVVVQVSLSFMLLVGAGLIIQSLQRIRTADPGFSTENVLTTAVDLVGAGYDAQRAKTFEDGLIDRVQALPGVQSAAMARVRPFSYNEPSSGPIAVDGYQPAPDEVPTAEYNQVTPGYLRTMGIPLLDGRDFTRADNETAPLVAIVNETMVARYWHGADPVGKRLQVKGKTMQVIGIAKTTKYSSFREAPKPFFYVPLRQDFSMRAGLSIRTNLKPGAMAAVLAREVHALDVHLAPYEVTTMREDINFTALASQKVAVALLSIFGGLALLLAAIGLYGVMSYSVSQSARELALRMALGARAADVLRLVMSNGLMLTAGGVLLGAVAALGLTRLISNVLYKVSPRDPVAFGLALVVMMFAALAACFVPAWRALRVDPVRALRN
jgi:predicted permease